MNGMLRAAFSVCLVAAFSNYSMSNPFDFAKRVAGKAVENIKSKAIEETSKLKGQGQRLISKAKDKATELKEQGQGLVSKAKDKATELKEQAVGIKTQGAELISSVGNAVQNSALALVGESPSDATVDTAESTTNKGEDSIEADPDIITLVDPIFSDHEKIEKSKLLNAKGLELTDKHMLYFAKCLEKLATMGVEKLTLNLAGNSITATSLSILFEIMKANPKLISILSLSHNNIGDEGATLLANYLPNLAAVKFIILDDTGITGDGALVILSEIAKRGDGVLQMLDFSNNTITSDYWNFIIEQVKLFKNGMLEDGIIVSKDHLNLPQDTAIPTIVQLV